MSAFDGNKLETEHLIRHNQPSKQTSAPDYFQLFFYFLFFCAFVGAGIALVILTVGSDPLLIVTFAGIFIVIVSQIGIAMFAYCGFSLEDS